MPSYSVAQAKNGFSALIDRALSGEEVIITRRGEDVIELTPRRPGRPQSSAAWDRLSELRDSLPPVSISSVDLLNQMYEEGEV